MGCCVREVSLRPAIMEIRMESRCMKKKEKIQNEEWKGEASTPRQLGIYLMWLHKCPSQAWK